MIFSVRLVIINISDWFICIRACIIDKYNKGGVWELPIFLFGLRWEKPLDGTDQGLIPLLKINIPGDQNDKVSSGTIIQSREKKRMCEGKLQFETSNFKRFHIF